MFKIIAGLFSGRTTINMEEPKLASAADDAVRKPPSAPAGAMASPGGAPATVSGNKPKRISDVSQMRLAAYIERSGATE